MITNDNQRGSQKVVTIHELDAISAIQAELALITKQLGATNVSTIQTPNSSCDHVEEVI